jgi:hypothetical protein
MPRRRSPRLRHPAQQGTVACMAQLHAWPKHVVCLMLTIPEFQSCMRPYVLIKTVLHACSCQVYRRYRRGITLFRLVPSAAHRRSVRRNVRAPSDETTITAATSLCRVTLRQPNTRNAVIHPVWRGGMFAAINSGRCRLCTTSQAHKQRPRSHRQAQIIIESRG